MASEPHGKNRLAHASSPYLLLHQDNPVDWYPWGPEALERARREDKPIFVSVGYSTCHWCHVMEHESFSDPGIAEIMNELFVNVKIDREERPDLDEIYMAATQILSHQGGWPNSVFLTPDLVPYFAGTYFPPEDRMGRPGFVSVLRSMAAAWKERRADVEAQAESVATAMRRYLEERDAPAAEPAGPEVAVGALASLEETFDEAWGGFGGAPKFPTPANLLLLLEEVEGRANLEPLLDGTLDRMSRGGIYDQLAGGFHRYATDREWNIPHFEKMLYDNGLLLEAYARRFGQTGDPGRARVVRGTARFLEREMTSPEGAFWSAIDADSEGREGAYYVWTRDELLDVLGDENFGFLAPLYGFDGPPFFEGAHWVLHRPQPWEAQAERRQLTVKELIGQVEPFREKLLAVRESRPRPGTDDKILADWNGTVITGLAVAGRLLGEPGMTAAAATAADFVYERMRGEGGHLLHSWRQGVLGSPAFLSDYAFLVRGLLELHLGTGEDRWLARAVDLTEEQTARLGDPSGGFFVAGESPDVLFRSREVFDGAVPGANGIAGLNLLDLAERTGEERWLTAARDLLRAFAPVARRVPQASRTLAIAALRHHRLTGTAPEAPRTVPATPGAGAFEPLESGSDHVTAKLDLEPRNAEGWQKLRLRLAIEPGWHIQSGPSGGEALRLGGQGVEVGDWALSAATRHDSGTDVWEGVVDVEGTLRTGDPGAHLRVSYQLCDDHRCLAPTRLELPLDSDSEPT